LKAEGPAPKTIDEYIATSPAGVQPTTNDFFCKVLIPPTAVGGWFKSFLGGN